MRELHISEHGPAALDAGRHRGRHRGRYSAACRHTRGRRARHTSQRLDEALGLAVLDGQRKRCGAPAIGRVREFLDVLGAHVSEQQFADVGRCTACGGMQDRHPVSTRHSGIDFLVRKHLAHHFRAVAEDRVEQRRLAALVEAIGLDIAMIQKHVHHGGVAPPRGAVQRRAQAVECGRADVGAVSQEQLHHIDVPTLGREMHRRALVRPLAGSIRPMGQQQPHDVRMAGLRGQVQGRTPLLVGLLDQRRPGQPIEQVAHRGHVAGLCCQRKNRLPFHAPGPLDQVGTAAFDRQLRLREQVVLRGARAAELGGHSRQDVRAEPGCARRRHRLGLRGQGGGVCIARRSALRQLCGRVWPRREHLQGLIHQAQVGLEQGFVEESDHLAERGR